MEEDIELLRSMYVEGEELAVEHYTHITRLTFHLSKLISPDHNFCLIVDIIPGHVTISDVKLKSRTGTVSLESDVLGISLSDSFPSEILARVTDNIGDLEKILSSSCTTESPSKSQSDIVLWRTVYKLDHMRNENKYRKCLAKFAKQTRCHCLLYSSKHVIRIVVEGEKEAVSEFVKLNKTEGPVKKG
ncbi:hypothetical protein ACHWQZ_G004035 [Mnemiopsis leidyi]